MQKRWLHNRVTVQQGAYLPHWTAAGGIYATCFRLADSLPQPVLNEWRTERAALLAQISKSSPDALTSAERERVDQLFAERVERYLDAGYGACWLKQPQIAGIAATALRHFENER